MKKQRTSKQNMYISAAAAVVLLAAVGVGAYMWGQKTAQVTPAAGTRQAIGADEMLNDIPNVDSNVMTKDDAMTERLMYLIEEEKLAHDVYVAMYDKWGSRVFNNIQQSETSHQAQVLSVMEARGIKDPRLAAGKFENTELQALYDKLVAQGSQNIAEAYKVGVAIEELDIADLKRMMGELPAADEDVRAVMDNLLMGSENHLRAFNRQLARVQ